jgi:hypothetical protein
LRETEEGAKIMATLTATFRTLKQYPADNARNHTGSLVGKTIAVDPVHGRDFEDVYRPDGWGPQATEQFTVISDNECAGGTGARQIQFRDRHGHVYSGNATRFSVLGNAATAAAPAPATGTAKQPYQPDRFGNIMDITRGFCR